ncbi:GNAT family N-acetyltransferase [Streptomycetaceae bacterium NBC_01309]
MGAEIRLHGDDTSVLAYVDGIRTAYVEAFCAPPWSEDTAKADAYITDALPAHVHLPGFAAAVAVDDGTGEVVGFATGWTTADPFPADRCYPQAAAGLGPERTRAWLTGAFEIDELAVRPQAQGTGLASALLDAVTAHRADGRCWLLTSQQSPHAVAFYRRTGWTQATHPSPDGKGIVVFLGPLHPDRLAAPLPLSAA